VVLQLVHAVLGLAVAERLVQRAQLPLQGGAALPQGPAPPARLLPQLPQPRLARRQPPPRLPLRGGAQVVELADLQGQGVTTPPGAEGQEAVAQSVQLLHLALLALHRLQERLVGGGSVCSLMLASVSVYVFVR